MELRILVIALIAALGSSCASTDKARLAYEIKPDLTVRHGVLNAQSYYQLARYYHGQKRLDMAETAYIKSLALDCRTVDAYNALGSLYAERGQLERSVQQFEKALQIDPRAGYVYNNLGFAHFLQGRLVEAYDAVRKALTFDATLERGWSNLELIAIARSDKNLLATAKSRKTEALPATLLATNEISGQPPSAPAEEVPAKAAITPPPDVTEPIPDSSQANIAVANGRGVSAASIATGPKAPAPTVASAAGASDSQANTVEERVDDGQFVLVSSNRETANRSEPLKIAEAKPAATAPLSAKAATVAGNSEIDISNTNVEISNANGVGGFAKKFSAQLREGGIPVKRITNYDSFLLKETIIEYQPGHQNAAHTLMLHAQLDARLTLAKGPRARSDVRIVLGRNALGSLKTTLAMAP